MEKRNIKNVDWKELKASPSAFPMAASCTDTTTENSLRVLKNLMSLLRAGIAQLALDIIWNGWSADILSTFLPQVNWKKKEVFSPSAPGCFRTPTGTMTVGGGELRAPEAWACCKGGIVEQYSAGLLGLGLWLEALIMFSQAWAKANKEQEPWSQRKVSNSPNPCVKFSAVVRMDPATSQICTEKETGRVRKGPDQVGHSQGTG